MTPNPALDAIREAINFGGNPFRDGTRMFTSHEMKRSDCAARADDALDQIEQRMAKLEACIVELSEMNNSNRHKLKNKHAEIIKECRDAG